MLKNCIFYPVPYFFIKFLTQLALEVSVHQFHMCDCTFSDLLQKSGTSSFSCPRQMPNCRRCIYVWHLFTPLLCSMFESDNYMGDLTLHPHIPDGMLFFCLLVCGGGVVCASVLSL